MQALMKLSRGNATPRTVNWSEENFSPPPVASLISGFRNADVSPPTTLANAAPITTPTAISTTLPRRMNFLNPSSIDTSKTDWSQMYDRKASRSSPAGRLGYLGKCNLEGTSSDPHRHHNIAVLIIIALGRPQLPRRLRILQLQPHLIRSCGLQKVDQVLRIEADAERLPVIGRFHRILGLARFRRRRRKFHFALFQLQTHRPRTLIGKLRHAQDRRI